MGKINDLLGTLPVIGKYFPTFRPGHYYSPIVDHKELSGKEFSRKSAEGVDLNLEAQLKLLGSINEFVHRFEKYTPDNGMFPPADAHVLQFMLQHYSPKHIAEIGCGYSSAAMLDIAKPGSDFLFVDPEPGRFLGLIQDHHIVTDQIQNVSKDHFLSTDLFFVDSSHVCKTGSDVHYILFELLPYLKSGTLIHFHDVFFPFEYPEYWVKDFYRGFGWNEAYMLRAFLTGNKGYKIVYWDSCVRFYYPEKIRYEVKPNAGSIWIQKI